MAFIEIIGVAIVVLLIWILVKLSKKEEEKKEGGDLADKLLLNQLKNIEKTLDDQSKTDKENGFQLIPAEQLIGKNVIYKHDAAILTKNMDSWRLA